MKKIIVALLLLFLWGCGKKYDNVIDNPISSYQIASVKPINSFLYSPGKDSVLNLKISVRGFKEVSQVTFDIINPDGNNLNDQPVIMSEGSIETDTANPEQKVKYYFGKFAMSSSNINGQYEIDYYVTDNSNSTKKAAVEFFNYNNGQLNVAPVISNLVAPDSITFHDISKTIFLSVEASDSNGIHDIKKVFLNYFTPPDSTPSAGDPYLMYDNGTNGDSIAGDGIYSLKIQLPPNFPTGKYKWEFEAQDRFGANSNIIVHYMNIKKDNIPPVVSNLVAPDTLTVGRNPKIIFLSVKATDSNGLRDIQKVFFNSYIPPDGHASSSNPFLMYDDGTNGDSTAGDGIYSLEVRLPTNVPKGKYRWEFQAEDWSDAYSNKIIHYVVVQ